MKRRILKNQQVVTDAPTVVKMTIHSRCPKKWAFVDMETGDIWVHPSRIPPAKRNPFSPWVRADDKVYPALADIILRVLAKDLV